MNYNVRTPALAIAAESLVAERYLLLDSTDWDEIQQQTNRVFLPYQVMPTGKIVRPQSLLHSVGIGRFTLSRFKYGVPIRTSHFNRSAGVGAVLTGLSGSARHIIGKHQTTDTARGEAFVVDISQVQDYEVSFDEQHLQLNCMFPHALLSDYFVKLYGTEADARMWQFAFKLEASNTAWHSLLMYCSQCIDQFPEAMTHGALGRRLEELIAAHLLTQWQQRLTEGKPFVTLDLSPRHVMRAERYVQEHARFCPTLTDIAQAVGVSVRTLNASFRAYRQTTPMMLLREARMNGVRTALLQAPEGASVRSIVLDWGYLNMGMFAGDYQRRFGELPSTTLRRNK